MFSMVKQNLDNPFSDAPVYYREVTGSTMEDSKKEASRGILHGTVYRAEFQEKGRGRIRGRRWLSDQGLNLMFTLVLRRDSLEQELTHLPLIAGAALTEAVRKLTGDDFLLKWPNDLLYDDRKCAGILCEADADYFYCGMGINCNQSDFPHDIAQKGISLKLISGKEIDRDDLLVRILGNFKKLLETGEEWRGLIDKFLYKAGQHIEVRSGRAGSSSIVRGIILGIGESGQLLVRQRNGEIEEIFAGEIEI